ncbi:MAG: response regulator transcription factor [Chloroflexota bacterium]|nr:response regulator transcription factor [Chloroflexota bacterium]
MSISSILLVEDHPAFADALLRVLNTDKNINVVAVLESAEKALEQIADLKVDLVLSDISLPQMSGINLVGELQKKYPGLPCIVLSGHLSTEYARRAMEAGARGYVIKDNPVGILEGIRRVLKGEVYMSEELSDSSLLGPSTTAGMTSA